MTIARLKAATSNAFEANRSATVDDLVEVRHEGGISIWSLGPVACVIETLTEDAPGIYTAIMRRRVLANLTGHCPGCGAVAGVTHESRGELIHATRCIVGHPPRRMTAYLDPAATAAICSLVGDIA
ncbi:hypothetical protein ACFC3F_06625 [Microbacterium sp. NPDC055910]|uniref:hypothetical protein n=1 Tax=Microbacterium sp. NPDC055910 TaxID=3345659 RepID=UPI0035DBBBF3